MHSEATNWFNGLKTQMQPSRVVLSANCRKCADPAKTAKDFLHVLEANTDCARVLQDHPDGMWLLSQYEKHPSEGVAAYVRRLLALPAEEAPRSEMDCLTCGYGIEKHATALRELVICAGENSINGLVAGDPVSWTVGDDVVEGHIYYCGDNDITTCIDGTGVLHSIKNAAFPGVIRPLSCTLFRPGKVTCVGESHPMCSKCVDAYAPAIDNLKRQAEAHLCRVSEDSNKRKRDRSSPSQSVRATACTAIMHGTVFADIDVCPAPQSTVPQVAHKIIKTLVAKRFKVESCTKVSSGLPAHAMPVCNEYRKIVRILTKGARFTNTAVAGDETSLYSMSNNYQYLVHKLYEAEKKFNVRKEGATCSSDTRWKPHNGYMLVKTTRFKGKHVEMITSLAHGAKEHRARWMSSRHAHILAAAVKRMRATGAVDVHVAMVAEQVLSTEPSIITTEPSTTTSNLI